MLLATRLIASSEQVRDPMASSSAICVRKTRTVHGHAMMVGCYGGLADREGRAPCMDTPDTSGIVITCSTFSGVMGFMFSGRVDGGGQG